MTEARCTCGHARHLHREVIHWCSANVGSVERPKTCACDRYEPVGKDMAEKFPFTTPAGSDARMFIQWKGTRVCLDFWCPCGTDGHLDADFAYYMKCPACGQVYEMGTQVIARKVDGDDYPSTQVLAVDDAPQLGDTTAAVNQEENTS